MRYIIMTQKDRKVEEILFDHEHEDVFNMDLRKTKKQSMTEEVMFSFNDIQYRRREFRLKKRLNMALYLVISISIVFFIIYTIHEFVDPFDDKIIESLKSAIQISYEVTIIGYGILRIGLFAFNILLSMNVYYLMKKLHNFEFERNKQNMRLMILLYLVNLIVICFVYIVKVIGIYGEFFKIIWLLNYPLQFPNIFLCFIMINVKSSSDILQGLSKLDHLLKVSAF